jgi:hypothetical protein
MLETVFHPRAPSPHAGSPLPRHIIKRSRAPTIQSARPVRRLRMSPAMCYSAQKLILTIYLSTNMDIGILSQSADSIRSRQPRPKRPWTSSNPRILRKAIDKSRAFPDLESVRVTRFALGFEEVPSLLDTALVIGRRENFDGLDMAVTHEITPHGSPQQTHAGSYSK